MKNDKQITITLEVALPLPLRKQFGYAVPMGAEPENLIGMRALVPFGKRVLTGYITGTGSTDKVENLKDIIELLDEEPAFDHTMLEFTRWISEYYYCSWGEALKAAIPSGMSPKSIVKVNINTKVTEETISKIESKAPKSAEILKILSRSADFVTVGYLEHLLKTDSIAAQISLLQRKGLICIEKSLQSETKKLVLKAVKIPDELFSSDSRIKEILAELDNSSVKSSVIFSTVYLHQQNSAEPCFIAKMLRDTGLKRHNLTTLLKKNYLEEYDAVADRSIVDFVDYQLISKDESGLQLNNDQKEVYQSIEKALISGNYNSFLLHGVTGSGKTLVYINAISKSLELGLSSIILVPEISLTPQLIERFSNAFGGNLAVIHSRMSAGERYDSWQSIKEGKVSIVLGARSAIFAPVSNLGLIIVDEEHEPGYKQDSPAPRYNARDAAVALAKISKATIVLGSATPSLESMYNAETGKYQLLKIEKRADNANMPEIKILDTRIARKEKKMNGLFNEELISKIIEKVNKKEGVMLFRNRRGFSSYLECDECGHIPKCIHCSVSLTYHKVKNHMRCHYCGYTIEVINQCPECGSSDFYQFGSGTQKIEEELNQVLAQRGCQASIFRMDMDTTRGKDSHRKILYKFASGAIDILTGTQMIAKGLDFDRVTLVGVIDSDQQLFLPDFRASERTFQLLTQVSGRAGRAGNKPGLVLIQTAHPEADAIKYCIENSYQDFYRKELEFRINAGYPPATRVVAIEINGKNKDNVNWFSSELFRCLPQRKTFYEMLGPVEPYLNKVRDYYRKLIILKNFKSEDPNGTKMRAALDLGLTEYSKLPNSKSVSIIIDIDARYNL